MSTITEKSKPVQSTRWQRRPQVINELNVNSTISHVIFMDENGDSTMNHIEKMYYRNQSVDINSKHFTLTGVMYKVVDLPKVRDNFIKVKAKYWPEVGCFDYPNGNKKVCFHSSEVRRAIGPFDKNLINYDEFINDLSNLITDLPIRIASSSINKEAHFKKYLYNAIPPYELSLTFLLERFIKQISANDEVIIVLEARGKKEDKIILQHIMDIINNGTFFVESEQFSKIKGVYFNRKRPVENQQISYYGLETADLCSHPIHRYCVNGNKNRSFESIVHKIYGYPNFLNGTGIKKFP